MSKGKCCNVFVTSPPNCCGYYQPYGGYNTGCNCGCNNYGYNNGFGGGYDGFGIDGLLIILLLFGIGFGGFGWF